MKNQLMLTDRYTRFEMNKDYLISLLIYQISLPISLLIYLIFVPGNLCGTNGANKLLLIKKLVSTVESASIHQGQDFVFKVQPVCQKQHIHIYR